MTAGHERVRAAIARANGEGRAALVCYLPAGYPDLTTARACLLAAAEAGADVLEVGFPFSDPVMDGPTIQAATQAALEAGVTLDDDFAMCAALTADLDALEPAVPAVTMTYVTLPAARGYARFADDALEAGLCGVILPDLPVDEADDWLAEARRTGLATIFLAARTSTDERLAAIAEHASGFVYATSMLGVTGTQDRTADASDLVARLREVTDLPVAVGIGVSTPEQAADVAGYADGVIVGSALVRAVRDGERGGAPHRVSEAVRGLRSGIEQAAGA